MHGEILSVYASKVNHLVIESQTGHGVMLTVAGPEGGLAKNRSSGNEGIANFEVVAPGVFTQELSGQLTNVVICRNAEERTEETGDELVFVGERASPDFCRSDWGVENNRT